MSGAWLALQDLQIEDGGRVRAQVVQLGRMTMHALAVSWEESCRFDLPIVRTEWVVSRLITGEVGDTVDET